MLSPMLCRLCAVGCALRSGAHTHVHTCVYTYTHLLLCSVLLRSALSCVLLRMCSDRAAVRLGSILLDSTLPCSCKLCWSCLTYASEYACLYAYIYIIYNMRCPCFDLSSEQQSVHGECSIFSVSCYSHCRVQSRVVFRMASQDSVHQSVQEVSQEVRRASGQAHRQTGRQTGGLLDKHSNRLTITLFPL